MTQLLVVSGRLSESAAGASAVNLSPGAAFGDVALSRAPAGAEILAATAPVSG